MHRQVSGFESLPLDRKKFFHLFIMLSLFIVPMENKHCNRKTKNTFGTCWSFKSENLPVQTLHPPFFFSYTLSTKKYAQFSMEMISWTWPQYRNGFDHLYQVMFLKSYPPLHPLPNKELVHFNTGKYLPMYLFKMRYVIGWENYLHQCLYS